MRQIRLSWLLFTLFILLPLILRQLYNLRKPQNSKLESPSTPKPRILKPKADKDCPCCQAEIDTNTTRWFLASIISSPGVCAKAPAGKRNPSPPKVTSVPTRFVITTCSMIKTFMPWLASVPMANMKPAKISAVNFAAKSSPSDDTPFSIA